MPPIPASADRAAAGGRTLARLATRAPARHAALALGGMLAGAAAQAGPILPPPGTASERLDDFYLYATRVLDYLQPAVGWSALAGTGQIGFVPLADDNKLSLVSAWPHPTFGGDFLPRQRTVNADGFEAQHIDETVCEFRALTREEIAAYVAAEPATDCAGGFKCEGLGITLFERLRSEDPTALIGLPLIWLARTLRPWAHDDI